MNSKDLNSINEAFATATAKVVAEDIKEDKAIVTEGSKDDPLGTGKTDELSGSTRDVKNDKKDKKKKDKKVEEDINPHAYDDMADDEKGVGATVEIAADAPAGAGQSGQIIEVRPDTNTVVVATAAGEVEVDKNHVWPTGDNESSEVPTLDFDSVYNIMDDYENRLSRHAGVKRVREKNEPGKEYKKPDESVGADVDSKTQRPKGEVKADEKSKDVGDVKKDLQDPVEADEKDNKKDEKVVKESINNSNKGNIMSEDKSIFDKLYEQVMGEDDDFELGLPGDDAGLDVGDELGDEGGEEVTVTLTPDQAAALKAVVDQLPSDEDEPGADEECGGEEPPVDEFQDSVENPVEEDHTPTTGAPTSDGKTPGKDPSDGGGKTTDPAPDSLGGKSSGTGDAKVTDEETTGKPTTDGKTPGKHKDAGTPKSQAV